MPDNRQLTWPRIGRESCGDEIALVGQAAMKGQANCVLNIAYCLMLSGELQSKGRIKKALFLYSSACRRLLRVYSQLSMRLHDMVEECLCVSLRRNVWNDKVVRVPVCLEGLVVRGREAVIEVAELHVEVVDGDIRLVNG